MTLKEMLSLPWTWQGPNHVVDGDGERWELTIAELQDFFLVGETSDELLNEAWPALVAYLRSYSDRGEDPPMPSDRLRTWHVTVTQRGKQPLVAETAPELQVA
jgi:hypothetical protein